MSLPTSPPDPTAAPKAPGAGAAAADLRLQPQAVVRHLASRAAQPAAPAPWLHQEVARRMDDRLGLIRWQPRAMLEWWPTLGGGSALLQARYPAAQLHRVEPPMIAAPQRALAAPGWWRRLTAAAAQRQDEWVDEAPHWPWGDAGRVAPAQQAAWPGVQLLWANMMLHWADHPAPVFKQWFERLEEDGILMFSCLGPDTARELTALYASHGWAPAGAAFMDMHDVGDALVQAGFRDPVMDMETLRLTWASPAACLAELRTWGRNAHPRRFPGLRTPRWRDKLLSALSAVAGAERVSLTIEVIYGHAVRGPTRAPVAPTTEISLDAMREMVRKRGI